ncbi:MAG TPA: STAS domain-containing protein [Miltoncostaeaceae bacterium]|nr:STAS domain-containing protein [Miltoncostaeaceae bacterium]
MAGDAPPGTTGPFSLVVQPFPSALVCVVAGELDLATRQEMVGEVTAAAGTSPGDPVVLDLSGVEYADSSALHALLDLREHLGHGLALRAPPPCITRLFAATQLSDHFEVVADD